MGAIGLRKAVATLAVAAWAGAAERGCTPVEVFRDDFSRFPPGWLSQPIGRPRFSI